MPFVRSKLVRHFDRTLLLPSRTALLSSLAPPFCLPWHLPSLSHPPLCLSRTSSAVTLARSLVTLAKAGAHKAWIPDLRPGRQAEDGGGQVKGQGGQGKEQGCATFSELKQHFPHT
mgnify:CR=1 FL=1